MRLVKLDCPIISKALEDYNSFRALHMYIAGFTGFERTEDGCFLSKIVKCGDELALDFKLTLEDYFFNEHKEAEKLWEFAEKMTGKKNITWEVVKVVTI